MAFKGYILEDATTGRIPDANMAATPMGEIYFVANGTDTVITTQSTFTKVTIVTTLNTNVQFDSPSAGRLRYTGSVTRMAELMQIVNLQVEHNFQQEQSSIRLELAVTRFQQQFT